MPNLATTRAILWRRLAALRRRSAKHGAAPKPARVASGGLRSEPAGYLRPPGPLLVDYFGRDGSTALLRLLSTSPQIFVEGRYPYEHRHLGTALTAPDPAAAWRGFCQPRFGSGDPHRWYAEKMIDVRKADLSAFPDARIVVLLRDPRDTWVSVVAFSRAVGEGALGGVGTRSERLARFVERQRERLEWIAGLGRGDALVVRYESLVFDVAAVARELEAWLDVEIDPAGLAGDFRLRWVHGTAPDPARSVGRWRSELSDADLESLRAGLEGPIAAVGFGDWKRGD